MQARQLDSSTMNQSEFDHERCLWSTGLPSLGCRRQLPTVQLLLEGNLLRQSILVGLAAEVAAGDGSGGASSLFEMSLQIDDSNDI